MIICALVDHMGCLDMTPEDEYKQIKTWMERILETKDFVFKTDVHPWDIKNLPVDVYIIDYGGIMPGCDSMIEGIYRSLIEQIEDKPNTLFVLWSQFTARWYEEMMEGVTPELKGFNVTKRMDWQTLSSESIENFEKKLKSWVE